jgi:cytochrome c-type biogenesis protein CcmH/NrfG
MKTLENYLKPLMLVSALLFANLAFSKEKAQQMNKLNAAVAVFELNSQHYPDSANTHDSLGEAYLAVGEKQKALISYKRALELDPESESAKNAIEQLQ